MGGEAKTVTEATERIEEARPRRFRRYSAYKDSGIEWLGKIPKDWEVKQLKHVTTFSTGWTPPTGREDLYGGEHLWANISDLGAKILNATENTISDVAIQEARLRIVEAGSLLFSFKLSIGAVSIAGVNMYTNEAIAAFTPSSLIYTGYLFWAAPILIKHNAQTNIYGAALLNRERIANAKLLLPSPSEQRAIAAFLDRETAKIDGLVARKERLIELLQEKRTAIITRAVTRGLDPNVLMKDSGVEWLGEIPAHWEVKRLRHIMRHIEQGWSPDCENREAGADEWGVLKAGCVNRGTFLESEHKALPSTLSPIPALEIRKGDLLMSRASGSRDLVGSVAVVSECRPHLLLCDKVFRLHTESSAGHRQFIGYAMNSRIVRWQIESAISGGSGLASNISQEAVKDLVVVQPPRSERWEIAGYLDCETTRIDALISKIRQAINHLKEFRTALISAAVTGKIDVREEAS